MNTLAAKIQRIPPTRISQDGVQQLLHNQIRQAVRITVVAEPDAENVCLGHVIDRPCRQSGCGIRSAGSPGTGQLGSIIKPGAIEGGTT